MQSLWGLVSDWVLEGLMTPLSLEIYLQERYQHRNLSNLQKTYRLAQHTRIQCFSESNWSKAVYGHIGASLHGRADMKVGAVSSVAPC